MKEFFILNLDKTFNPFKDGANSFNNNMGVLYQQNMEIEFEIFNFPSGCEPHIKLKSGFIYKNVIITCRINSSNDLIILLLAVDALKRSGTKEIELFIPYLPFARQDRVMVKGEPLSVKVIANILNAQGFSKVSIFDPHSEVCLALIDNSEAISNHDFVERILRDKKDYLIICPDAGAFKKIFKLCQHLNYKDEIILCNKVRDVSNGKIISTTVNSSDLDGKDVYIIDDIADGAYTFVLIAEELKKRNAGKINLVVSHGIFSKGFDVLTNIDHVYTTNSFKDIPSNEKVTQLNVI